MAFKWIDGNNPTNAREFKIFVCFQFNIGIMEENPSTVQGVVNILENLHTYVPASGDQVHTLICWGDGLSCERHVDAQNARANAATKTDRLQGLEPSPQEFHKRMLLMQV